MVWQVSDLVIYLFLPRKRSCFGGKGVSRYVCMFLLVGVKCPFNFFYPCIQVWNYLKLFNKA